MRAPVSPLYGCGGGDVQGRWKRDVEEEMLRAAQAWECRAGSR